MLEIWIGENSVIYDADTCISSNRGSPTVQVLLDYRVYRQQYTLPAYMHAYYYNIVSYVRIVVSYSKQSSLILYFINVTRLIGEP